MWALQPGPTAQSYCQHNCKAKKITLIIYNMWRDCLGNRYITFSLLSTALDWPGSTSRLRIRLAACDSFTAYSSQYSGNRGQRFRLWLPWMRTSLLSESQYATSSDKQTWTQTTKQKHFPIWQLIVSTPWITRFTCWRVPLCTVLENSKLCAETNLLFNRYKLPVHDCGLRQCWVWNVCQILGFNNRFQPCFCVMKYLNIKY